MLLLMFWISQFLLCGSIHFIAYEHVCLSKIGNKFLFIQLFFCNGYFSIWTIRSSSWAIQWMGFLDRVEHRITLETMITAKNPDGSCWNFRTEKLLKSRRWSVWPTVFYTFSSFSNGVGEDKNVNVSHIMRYDQTTHHKPTRFSKLLSTSISSPFYKRIFDIESIKYDMMWTG